jgi:hypothetical protein
VIKDVRLLKVKPPAHYLQKPEHPVLEQVGPDLTTGDLTKLIEAQKKTLQAYSGKMDTLFNYYKD